nr:EF-hand calcium-binding domain-containing protein 13 isoform X5 [Equus asinus]
MIGKEGYSSSFLLVCPCKFTGNPFVLLLIYTCSSRPLSPPGQNLPLNRKMETKVHLFYQAEENTNLSEDDCNSFATHLPSIYIDSKKYIKFSKRTEKRISPEIRGLSLEHRKMYETSVCLCGEEKSSDFSREKKVRRKKSLQAQLHTERTEIASSSAKLSKEKMTRKENSLCKLPNQYSIHKTLLPLCTSSSIIRKKERLSNLYDTLYDEVPHGHLHSQQLSALQKACKIFSKIRSGKIYVNDLPMIHCILKISISDSEMRKALKTVDIDVNGMLDFSDFLKAVNDVCYLVSQDPAFKGALKIFCGIKGGRVAVDEVAAVLDSMDIPVTPETLQEVIKHANIDNNHMVNIGDIIFTLGELQQQYEDVSIMEGSALDETTSKRKLSNVSGCYLQYRKKNIFSSRQPEPSLSQKIIRKGPQDCKIMEENDDFEFKRSKNTLQMRKFLDDVDSSDVGFQEPYAKDGVNFDRSSEKMEIHDSKSKPQNLKSITSLKKSLDKSDIFSTPKLQKTAVRRHSSLLKQISSKEKIVINALENVSEAISKLQENYLAAEELQSILPSIGITLSDKEFKKIVTDTTRNENGMVKLDDFMSALSKEQSLPGYDVLTDVVKAIDKIKDKNIDCEDLNACLQNFGVYLSKPEFEKIIELTEADENKNVNFKEFIDTMMSNMELFSEKLLLPRTVENLHNLSKEKMTVSDLWKTLSGLNSNLKKDEFLAVLELGTVGEDNVVNVKDCIKALRDTQKFSNFIALKETIDTLDCVTESNQSAKDKYSDVLENTDRTYFTDDSLQEVLNDFFLEDLRKKTLSSNLKLPKADAIKEAAHILSHVDNGKIGIPNLERALKNLNVNLTEEDFNEALKSCDMSDSKEVDLKDFLKGIRESPHFKESVATQLLLATTQILQNDLIDVSDLKALLMKDDLHAANALLDAVSRHLPEHENGKIAIQEFMIKFSNTLTNPEAIGIEDAWNIVNGVCDGKVEVKDLLSTLESLGKPLNENQLKVLMNSPTETSEVSLKQILETLNTSKPAPEFEDTRAALNTVNVMSCNRIQVNDLKDAFDDLNVCLKPEEHQMLEKTLDVDEKGNVSLKSALLALKSNKRFQDFREVSELAKALDKVTHEKIDVDDVKAVLQGLGIYFPEEELQEVLTSISVDDEGKVDLKDCLTRLMQTPYFTKGSKIDNLLKVLVSIRKNVANPDDLGSMMKSIGVPLPQDVIERALKNVALTEDGTVNLEEFMGNLVNSEFSSLLERNRIDDSNLDTFLGNMRMEMSVDKTVNKNEIKDRRSSMGRKIDFSNVDAVLKNMDIKLTEDEQQELLEHLSATTDEDMDMETLIGIVKMLKEKIEICNLDNFLDDMGIELTYKEYNELVNHLPTSADGKINQLKLVDTMMTLKGGKVNTQKLSNVLEKMGVDLTNKEFQNLREHLPADADRQVELNKLVNEAKAVTGLQVDVHNLDTILGNMAIKLTAEDVNDLTLNLPVDGGEVVFNNMKKVPGNMGIELKDEKHWELVNNLPTDGGNISVSNLDSILGEMRIKLTEKEQEKLTENLLLAGGIVDVTKLDTVLQNVGMKLTGTESKDLIKNLAVDDNGKVKMKKLMDALKAFTGKKVDASDLVKVLGNMGIELTEGEFMKLEQTIPIDAAGQVYQNRLLDGVKSLKGGMVKVDDLDTVLENLGFKLTEQEHEDLTKNLPLNTNRKVHLNKLVNTVETITGEEVDVSDVEDVLGKMGITFTNKEFMKLLENLPLDANEKVYKKRLLGALKSLNGGVIDVNKLDAVLGNMGLNLTEEEIKDLKRNLPTDADEKVEIRKLWDGLKAFTGQKIDVQYLPDFLSNMGIELTDKEQMELLKMLPVDAAGKICENRLLDDVKSFKGGKVERCKINTVLEKMGSKLTEEEIKSLTDNLPVNANGKVDLDKLMEGVKALTGGEIDVSDVENVLGNMGIELTEKEWLKLLKNVPVDAVGKTYQNRLMSSIKSLREGTIDVNKLDTVLGNMGMSLTEKELKDLTQNLLVNGGKVDISNLKPLLEKMDIKLTKKELVQLRENLPTDANGKVDLSKMMDGVKTVTGGNVDINDVNTVLENMGIELKDKEGLELVKNLPFDGGNVNVNNLSTILDNMGIKLADEELRDLTQNLPVDVDKKISLETLMNKVKAFTGEKIDSSDLKNVLGNLGIELTDKEKEKLLETLPIDAAGKVYEKRLLKGLKSLQQGQGSCK